jgi:hypothetical protein
MVFLSLTLKKRARTSACKTDSDGILQLFSDKFLEDKGTFTRKNCEIRKWGSMIFEN